MVLVRERGRAMAAAAASPPTGMTAVLGGDRDEVLAALDEHGLTAANVNGAGQIVAGRHARAARGARRRPAGQGAAAPAAGRRRVPHRAHGAGRRRRCARLAAAVTPARPAHPPAVQPRRRGRHDGREVLARLVAPGQQPGALGPVHAHDGRPRRHRRASSCRRPAPSPAWPSASCPASRSSRSRRPTTSTAARDLVAPARQRVADGRLADLAAAGRARPRARSAASTHVGGAPARARRRGRHASSPRATSSRSSRRTAALSSSGWSRTATRSPRASRSSGCTPRRSPHDGGTDHVHRQVPRTTPASSASAATGRRGSSPTTRSPSASTPRRVDPRPVGIAQRRGRRARRDRRRHGRRRRRQGARRTPASRRRDRPRHRRHRARTCCRPRRRPPRSPTGSARPRRPRSTSTPPAPASATALALANDMIRGGSAEHVLVIGVEKLSDLIDSDDRSHRVHLRRRRGRRRGRPVRRRRASARSSGAPTAAVRRDQAARVLDRRHATTTSTSRRSRMRARRSSAGPSAQMAPVAQQALRGRRRHAPTTSTRSSRTRPTCASSTRWSRRSKLPEHVPVAHDIVETGNTSAASIPLALERMLETRRGPAAATSRCSRLRRRPTYAAQVVALP